MGDDSEWMKLPTDEKCQHKVVELIAWVQNMQTRLAVIGNTLLGHYLRSFDIQYQTLFDLNIRSANIEPLNLSLIIFANQKLS